MENEFNQNQGNEAETQMRNVETYEEVLERARSKQSLTHAIIFGVAAAIAGAILWTVITVATQYQIGYMALAIGLMVGFSVRAGGQGVDKIFGITGAVLALIGCLLGNFFSQIVFAANYYEIEYYEIIFSLDLGMIVDIMVESFSSADILFYAIATYEGYKFSFKKINMHPGPVID